MLLPPHEFVKPASLAEGLDLLRNSRASVQLMGGGTDVVFNMRGRLLTREGGLTERARAWIAAIRANYVVDTAVERPG